MILTEKFIENNTQVQNKVEGNQQIFTDREVYRKQHRDTDREVHRKFNK